LVNREVLIQTKKRLKKLREMAIDAQKSKDLTRIEVITKEMMNLNKLYIKEAIKPLIVSVIVLIVFFPWISHRFGGKVVLRLPIKTGKFGDILVGNGLGWVGWYIIVSLVVSWFLKKLFGVTT